MIYAYMAHISWMLIVLVINYFSGRFFFHPGVGFVLIYFKKKNKHKKTNKQTNKKENIFKQAM
jgi:hypothetical protein